MKYVDFERVKKQYREFWTRQNERPLVRISPPREKRPAVPEATSLEQMWFDIDFILKRFRAQMDGRLYMGAAFPNFCPNLGPDILSATLGCKLKLMETTTWAEHFVDNWDEFKVRFDSEGEYWKKMLEITQAALDDSNGDYFVGITDLHAGGDAVVALREVSRTMMDMAECPEVVERISNEILPVFKKQVDTLHDMINTRMAGSTNWMGLWHPGKWYVTSCDMSCMISPKDFDRYILPEIVDEIRWLDASIYHLDGPDALRHLDSLLAIPELGGVQWVYGAGNPSARHWLDVLKRIQAAGKNIVILVEYDDIQPLQRELKPQGLCMDVSVPDEETARRAAKLLEIKED